MSALSKAFEKRVRQLRQKKFRDKLGLFIAEGDKLILQLVESGCKLNEFVYVEDSLGFKGEQIELRDLKQVSALETPANSLAIFEKKEFSDVEDQSFSLYLEEIQDPGNLGTILRTATWFGHRKIYTSLNCADPYSPKVVQASMGAVGMIEVKRIALADCREVWAKAEIKILAADMNGQDYRDIPANSKTVLIVGNEGRGISDEARQLVDGMIKIPGGHDMESLNAAVSASILMSHWA